MANATILPDLFFGQWARPSAGNPQLAAPVSATGLDFTFTAPLLDADGNVITKAVVIGITKSTGYTEAVYFAPGAFTGDGTQATATARGVDLAGLDFTAGNPALAVAHNQFEKVFVQVYGVYESILNAVLRGQSVSSGGLNFAIGAGAAGTVTIQRNNGSFLGWLRHNTSTIKVEFSNDGAVWTAIDDTVASVLVKVSATDTTPGYLNDKITVGGSLTKTITSPAGDEKLFLEVEAVNVDVTYEASEFIPQGSPVSVNEDDTVVNTVYRTIDTGSSEVTFEASAASNIVSANVAPDVWVNVYAESSQCYAIAGTVDRDNVQTFGTETGAGAGTGESLSVCKLDDYKFGITYRKSGDNKLYARIGTVNETTLAITFGAEAEVGAQSSGAQGYAAISLVGTSTLVVVWRDTSNSNIGTAKAATFSGSTIGTFGTGEAMQAMTDITLCQIDDDAVVVHYRAADTFGYGELLVVSGTTVSSSAPVQIDSNASSAFQSSTITTGASGHALIVWNGGASGYVQARVVERDALTIIYPTVASAVTAAAGLTPDVAVLTSTKAAACYEETSSSDGKFNMIGISGTTLTVGSQYSYNSTNNVSSTAVAKVSSADKFALSFRDEADSNKGNSIVFQDLDNRSKCVGLAVDDIESGEEGVVRSGGLVEVTGAFTGAEAYYLGTSSTYSTDPAETGLKLGVAKNENEIDVSIEYSDVYVLLGQQKGELIAGTSTGVSTVAAPSNAQLLMGDTTETTGLTYMNPSFVGVGAMNKNIKQHNMSLQDLLINNGATVGSGSISYAGLYLACTSGGSSLAMLWEDLIAPMNTVGATSGLSWNSTQIKSLSIDFTFISSGVPVGDDIIQVGCNTTATVYWNATACYFRWNAVDHPIPTPSANTPYYCRLEFDGDTDTVNFYVNGTLAATDSNANSSQIDFRIAVSSAAWNINLIGGGIFVEYN